MDNSDLDKKYSCVSNKSELKAEQDRIVKLKAFNLILFRGKRSRRLPISVVIQRGNLKD